MSVSRLEYRGLMITLESRGPWIRRVRLKNFRRFSVADWNLHPGVNCLIGPGDSGKTTLLSALEYVLWPSNSLTVTDNDFHRARVHEELVIEAWLVNPPRSWRTDAKYFAYLQGFDGEHLTAEPSESEAEQTALQIELRVAEDLEPRWSVVKGSLPPRYISPAERSEAGMVRVGEDLAKNLRWTRGSALLRLTPSAGDVEGIVRTTRRSIRASSSQELSQKLQVITDQIAESARSLQALGMDENLLAGIDLDASMRGMGQVTLHTDQGIPAARTGKGTQRLLSIGTQLSAAGAPSILILDELEHGLEPFRVQHITQTLKAKAGLQLGQVILTTHSPRAIRELKSTDLARVLVNGQDEPDIKRFEPSLQGTIRWSPDALLCPRVIVCEGATEVGIVRGLVDSLQAQDPPSFVTVEPADAQGESNVVERVLALRGLGYDVAAMHDLDKIPKDLQSLPSDVPRFTPEDGNAIEHQLFKDLTPQGIRTAVGLACRFSSLTQDELAEKLRSRKCPEQDITALFSEGEISPQGRVALGQTANKDSWFKRIEYGQTAIRLCLPQVIPGSRLDHLLRSARHWMEQG